ncbi:hypothetical protein [Nonomuraea turkmeniaca]|uniref:hypothetical protein n=1 Tax=Nonomuraea turkmeniaca TaxID=103838 RepID=UPI0014770C8C|nr:hypothetical protein [Nonomuraea turkmeniaca]
MSSSLSSRSRFLASRSYDLVFDAMWYRLLNRHAEVNDDLAEEIAGLLARIC